MLSRGHLRDGPQVHNPLRDPSHLSKVLNGRKPCTPHLAARLDAALDAGGKVRQAAAVFNGALAPGQRDRLDWTASHPGRADEQAVDALARVLAAQRVLEDRVGSAPMLVAVSAQTEAAEAIAADAPAALRSQLLGITAQYGSFYGWLQESTGHLTRAVQVYDPVARAGSRSRGDRPDLGTAQHERACRVGAR